MIQILKNELLPRYGFAENVRIRLLQKGINNEIYVLTDGNTDFYLRMSPENFRSWEEIDSEIRLLLHLSENDVEVALPVQMLDGTYFSKLGNRYAVLFEDAGGEVRADKSVTELFLLGEALAKIHTCTAGLDLYKKPLDSEYFIDKPLAAIRFFFGDTDVYPKATEIAERLRVRFHEYENLSPGFLHGDPHNYNIRYTDLAPKFFDFDSFGFGPQMYDLGEQMWNILILEFLPETERMMQLHWLLCGYESVRPLDDAMRWSIPYYAGLRAFRLCGAFLLSAIRNGARTPALDVEKVRDTLVFIENLETKKFDMDLL
ncbi:MAG: phosphotransferase enzyme family protein [Eubacteriales bacterium]